MFCVQLKSLYKYLTKYNYYLPPPPPKPEKCNLIYCINLYNYDICYCLVYFKNYIFINTTVRVLNSGIKLMKLKLININLLFSVQVIRYMHPVLNILYKLCHYTRFH